MKYLLFLLFFGTSPMLFGQIYNQDHIYIDFDGDGAVDSLYLYDVYEDREPTFIQLVCQLSSKDFKKQKTNFIPFETFSYFTLSFVEGKLLFYAHLDGMERVYAELIYENNDIYLSGMARSQDGDNSLDGGGNSYLDLSTHEYKGEWTYYDHFDEQPNYRMALPVIHTQMKFPKFKLEAINEDIFVTFRTKCLKEFRRVLLEKFPKGSGSRDGYLLVDIDQERDADSLYFDAYDSRLAVEVYHAETDKYEEVYSERLSFYSNNYEIVETIDIGYFILRSLTDNQQIYFSFDMEKKEFIMQEEKLKNWIQSDLDGDGIIDSLKVKEGALGDEFVYFSYLLSSQDFEEVLSPTFLANGVVIKEIKHGFKISLASQQTDIDMTFRFDEKSKLLRLIGWDYWADTRTYSINLLTNKFIGTHVDPNDETKVIKKQARMKLPFVEFKTWTESEQLDVLDHCADLFD